MRWEIINGDSLRELCAMADASVDAIITDPPYSSGGMYRGDRTTKTSAKYVQSGTQVERPEFFGDTRDQRGWLAWSSLWLAECWRVAKDGAPIAMFTDWRMLPTATDAIQAGGWVWRGIADWNKGPGCRPSMGRFASQCEYIVWGSKGEMPIERGVGTLPGSFAVSVRQADKHHITGKPTDLMREVVKICTPGGIILDPFAGSGTTLVAAAREGYSAIGIEMSPEYATIARGRLDGAEAVKGTPLFSYEVTA